MAHYSEIDRETRQKLNELARHQLIKKLLTDIAVDLQVCALEGFDPLTYISALKDEIDRI